MTMHRLALLALLSLTIMPACGDDDGGDAVDADLVQLDDASDEVFLTIRDLVDRGELTIDDVAGSHMQSPADGESLSAASPPTFTWDHGSSTIRHGRSTGDFVWLSITCPNLERPVDVLAIETETWTVDADHWSLITEAALSSDSSQCTATLTRAYVDREIVQDGPYRTSSPSTYTITE
jgi:hypothetical protein